ncbi:MAG: radical SAM protein [Candidatus Bathyarchaeota archaeon]|nr:radical SAM protein [Candidatus Bathyarchaeota archaeon]
MLKSRMTHTPFFLAHAITYDCNSRCKTCTYWQMSRRRNEDLSTEKVYQLLDQAYRCGMRGYYLFGGEPTLREDIGEVVHYAKNRGFLTTMNTNGSLLAAKAEVLKDIDFLFVSLDYCNRYHDFIRGRPGSFDEVIEGIRRIRSAGDARVVLVATISRLNYDVVEPMAEFAKKMHVGISFNSVEPTVASSFEAGRSVVPVGDYGLAEPQLNFFYDRLLRLKNMGYPLMETKQVLEHFVEHRSWKCHFPKMFVYVSADNKIFNCTYNHTYDLNRGSFSDYFASSLFKNHVAAAEKCNVCIRTCVRGYCYTYALSPLHLLNLVSDAKNLL